MPSTFSTRLNAELMATGENVGVWGTRANDRVFQLFDEAIAGYEQVSVSAVVSLEIAQASSSPGRHRAIEIVGNYPTSGAFNVRVPPVERGYWIKVSVSASGVMSMNFAVSGQGGATVTAVSATNRIQVIPWTHFICDGTSVMHAGFLVKPGSNILLEPDGTVTVSLGPAVSGVLASIASQGAGFVVKTAASNAVTRSLTATTVTEISINNGNATSADPRIGLAQGLVFHNSFAYRPVRVSCSATAMAINLSDGSWFHVVIQSGGPASVALEVSTSGVAHYGPTFNSQTKVPGRDFWITVCNLRGGATVVRPYCSTGDGSPGFFAATTVSATIPNNSTDYWHFFTIPTSADDDPVGSGSVVRFYVEKFTPAQAVFP